MALFEAFYSQRFRYLIGWFEVGKTRIFGHNLVHQAMEKVKMIRERLRTAKSPKKSYADVKRRELEFEIYDLVFLKVFSMKGVIRFEKKGISVLFDWFVLY